MNPAKMELVSSWLAKAIDDLESARVLGTCDPPHYETGVYLCQQAAEKALKGFLTYRDFPFEKTHDVAKLLEVAAKIEPPFETWRDAAENLTPYATAFRYPSHREPPKLEAFEEAWVDAETIYRQVLAYLPDVIHPVRDPRSDS